MIPQGRKVTSLAIRMVFCPGKRGGCVSMKSHVVLASWRMETDFPRSPCMTTTHGTH